MKTALHFFQLLSEAGSLVAPPLGRSHQWRIISSTRTSCAAEEGLLPTCRPVAGVNGAEAILFGGAGPPR